MRGGARSFSEPARDRLVLPLDHGATSFNPDAKESGSDRCYGGFPCWHNSHHCDAELMGRVIRYGGELDNPRYRPRSAGCTGRLKRYWVRMFLAA